MNAAAVWSIIVAGIGILLLLIFLLPAGTEFFGKVGRWISKFMLVILAIFGLFVVLLGQTLMTNLNLSKKDENNGTSTLQYWKSQTEIFIFACTCAVLFGILLVIWQVNKWQKKNDTLCAQIRKVVHQIRKIEDNIKSHN